MTVLCFTISFCAPYSLKLASIYFAATCPPSPPEWPRSAPGSNHVRFAPRQLMPSFATRFLKTKQFTKQHCLQHSTVHYRQKIFHKISRLFHELSTVAIIYNTAANKQEISLFAKRIPNLTENITLANITRYFTSFQQQHSCLLRSNHRIRHFPHNLIWCKRQNSTPT